MFFYIANGYYNIETGLLKQLGEYIIIIIITVVVDALKGFRPSSQYVVIWRNLLPRIGCPMVKPPSWSVVVFVAFILKRLSQGIHCVELDATDAWKECHVREKFCGPQCAEACDGVVVTEHRRTCIGHVSVVGPRHRQPWLPETDLYRRTTGPRRDGYVKPKQNGYLIRIILVHRDVKPAHIKIFCHCTNLQ